MRRGKMPRSQPCRRNDRFANAFAVTHRLPRDGMAHPAAMAEKVSATAELRGSGRGAFKNIGHPADAARVLIGDLRDVFFQSIDLSENGHCATGSTACYFRA